MSRESGYLRPGQLGYSNASTSREAAEKAEGSADSWRRRVLEFVRGRGPQGATDDELAACFAVSANTVAPRRTELAAAGRVVNSGKRRMTRAGGTAIVWVVPPEPVPAGEQGRLF